MRWETVTTDKQHNRNIRIQKTFLFDLVFAEIISNRERFLSSPLLSYDCDMPNQK